MEKCPFCKAYFISLLGFQDHLDDDFCPKWCGKCGKRRPTKTELESFIMGGGAEGDCPQICPHVID